MAISEKARLDKIPISVARLRNKRFRNDKKDAISYGIGKTADEYIEYDPAAFLAICRQVLNSAANITGMKIYFACYNDSFNNDRVYIPNGKSKLVSLVFVPTVRSGSDLTYDCNGYYYLMNAVGDGHTPVSQGTATRWVSLFQDEVLPGLSEDDTKALWYNRALIEDMITKVELEIQSHETTQMLYCFGMYEQGESMRVKINGQDRQLPIGDKLTGTFLFGTDLINEINRPLTTEERTAARRWIQEQATVTEEKGRPLDPDPDSYDTGIPIPPAGGGGGEGLP